jgi:hypothetical protein
MQKIDIYRPSTWKEYQSALCKGCWGGCCTMPVEIKISDLVRLGLSTEAEAVGSISKLAKRLFKEGFIQSYQKGTEFFILAQKENQDCRFLNSTTRLCTVYEQRPDTCRQFPSIGPRPGFCPAGIK